jgi:hypothetical protein
MHVTVDVTRRYVLLQDLITNACPDEQGGWTTLENNTIVNPSAYHCDR